MSVTRRKEWFGERGYCNCLLVVMARSALPHLDLHSNEPPPNLERLTSRPETKAWLRAQEFDYSALDPSRIIQTLANLAGITKSFWRYKRDSAGTLSAHDCVEDDGPVVERHFALRLLSSGGVLHLNVALGAPKRAPQ
ncbi:hypothetical protein AYO41_02580 [Verrucomicrobia bacterium SCGC AG-212-E04]|nr:hypothetical protein AYO41_02580 [Verrucomicrobia bacterium SCGC AG-212-E04]